MRKTQLSEDQIIMSNKQREEARKKVIYDPSPVIKCTFEIFPYPEGVTHVYDELMMKTIAVFKTTSAINTIAHGGRSFRAKCKIVDGQLEILKVL